MPYDSDSTPAPDTTAAAEAMFRDLPKILRSARYPYRCLARQLGLEEAIGLAGVSITKALRAFQPERGLNFRTLAATIIYRDLVRACQRDVRRQLENSALDEAGTPDAWSDRPAEVVDATEAAAVALRRMSRRQRRLVLRHVCDGVTLTHLAALANTSRQAMRKRLVTALAAARA